jgi:hypothetical protein
MMAGSNWKGIMMNKVVLGVILGIGGFFLLICAGGVGFLAGFQVARMMPTTPMNIDYVLIGPSQVTAGQPIVLELTVTNRDSSPQQLYSIDIYSEIVNEDARVTADPAPSLYNQRSGYHELIYTRYMEPGATEQITLTLPPAAVGSYLVNIDVCINGPMGMIERYHQLEVVAP